MANRPPHSVKWPLTPHQVEAINDMIEELYRITDRDTDAILDAIEDAIEEGDLGAPGGVGAHQEVLYNNNGDIDSDSGFIRSIADSNVRFHGVGGGGTFTINPVNDDYTDFAFGATIDAIGNYTPIEDNFVYYYYQASTYKTGMELMWDETAGVASGFARGVGYQFSSPDTGDGNLPGIDIYQYGGLGTGAVTGMGLIVSGNNDSGNGAAAWLGASDKAGNRRYFWPDANGTWRFHTTPPTESGSVADTVAPANSLAAANFLAVSAGRVGFDSRARITSPADSVLLFTNDAATDFGRLQFGGTTSSFPALKRSTTTIQVRLADDSANADLTMRNILAQTGYTDMLELAAPSTPAADTIRLWNLDSKGFNFFAAKDATGATSLLSQDNFVVVRNSSGSTIVKGKPVYITTGTTGNVPNVALARADDVNTMPAIGLTFEDITNGSFGRVMIWGTMNFDTSAYSAGDRLFIDETTAGAFRTTLPAAPNFAQRIALVTVSGVGNGEVLVTQAFALPQTAASLALDDLTDVDAPTPSNGDVLAFNTGSGNWENTAPGAPGTHASSHEDGGLDEIDVTGLSGLLADPQTPDLHASTHYDSAPDEIDITMLGGFPGGTTDFLRADGTFATPPGAGGGGGFANILLLMGG